MCLDFRGLSKYRVENKIENCGTSSPTAVSTLTINRVKMSDNGYYNCEAISGDDRAMTAN